MPNPFLQLRSILYCVISYPSSEAEQDLGSHKVKGFGVLSQLDLFCGGEQEPNEDEEVSDVGAHQVLFTSGSLFCLQMICHRLCP